MLPDVTSGDIEGVKVSLWPCLIVKASLGVRDISGFTTTVKVPVSESFGLYLFSTPRYLARTV